ncbi:MAG: LysR family transcriptional regulator [Planctomycetota bacterium]
MARKPPPSTHADPNVRLHQLEGFFHVCRHGGFARAVQALPYAITEPALHQQVRKLERELGVRLLVQGAGRRLLPTPAGRTLYQFVARYFEQLPGVLRSISDGSRLSLALGVEPLYIEGLCAEAIESLRRDHPQIGVRVAERDAPAIVTGVEHGEFDLGVSSLPPFLPPGLRFQGLGRLSLSLLVPTGHALARRRVPLSVEGLTGHAFIVYEAGTAGRSYTDAVLAQLGLTLEVAAEASTALGMRALVRAGVGAAFVPALVKRATPKRRPQARSKLNAGGIVEFGVSELLHPLIELPEFGWITRRDTERSGPIVDLIARLRRLLEA